MENNLPKYIAIKTLIKHKQYSLNSYVDLQRIIESKQFIIIEYQKHTNSQLVSELIKGLGLENEVERNDSFLYINNRLKFVFLNADISEEDKCALLRHELGHICDPNFEKSDIQNPRIEREEFANEFSCYAKKPGIGAMICVFLIKKRKLLVGTMALTTCALGLTYMIDIFNPPAKPVAGYTLSPATSDSTYYVTSAGEKYHRKHCITIKYKNNLTEITLDNAINDGYEPCLVCNPDV